MPDRTPVGWLLLEGLTNQCAGYVICLAKSKWLASLVSDPSGCFLKYYFINLLKIQYSTNLPLKILRDIRNTCHHMSFQLTYNAPSPLSDAPTCSDVYYSSILSKYASNQCFKIWSSMVFSLFLTRPGPDQSLEISFLGKNQTGLGKPVYIGPVLDICQLRTG